MKKYSKKFNNLKLSLNPKVFNELLKASEIIINQIPPKYLVSIYLIGSSARNELSVINTNKEFDIMSDYEFIIVSSSIKNPWINNLKLKLTHLIKSFGNRSLLFNIDFGVIPYVKLKFIPSSFWSFEFAHCGVLVFGKEVRNLIKKVNIDNLDFGNLNWLIVVRLWSFLKNYNYVRNYYKSFKLVQRHKNLLLARNLLEIPSIALPYFGILKPGYKNRINLVKLSSKFTSHFGGKNIYLEALNFKLRPTNKLKNSKLNVKILIQEYVKVIELISEKKWNKSPDTILNYVRFYQKKNFFKFSFFKELRMFNNSLNYFNYLIRLEGLLIAFKWLISPARYNFLGFLISYYYFSITKSLHLKMSFIRLSRNFLNMASGKNKKLSKNLNIRIENKSLLNDAKKFMDKWYEYNRN